MKKSTKGALAAATAGTLLLGGAGTLAFWTDAVTIDGTDLTSGHLKLINDDCSDWVLDGETDPYDPATVRLVPGDTLTRTCTYDISASGDHLTADFDVDEGTFFTGADELIDVDGAGPDGGELVATADYLVNAAPVGVTNVPVVNGDQLTVNLEIDWPYNSTDTDAVAGEDNESNVDGGGLTAALDDITITVTQSHTP